MTRLTKHDVEELLAVLAAPPDDIGAEVDGLRAALTRPLLKVVGWGEARDWDGLIGRAGAVAGWEDDYIAALLDRRAEGATGTRAALWDLATVLNEERDLQPT